MNDFERKLHETPLRRPPQELREQILSELPASAPAASWREWLWPAPPAWLALAAVWLVLFTIEGTSGTKSPNRASRGVFKMPPPELLLALRNEQALALMR